MQLLVLLALALPVTQEAPAPLSKSAINRLMRTLVTGTEARAESAAQELLVAGSRVLPYLPDSLVRTEERWRKNEGSLESAERVRALRLMVAASDADALDDLLEQAGDSRSPVRTRCQHALAVLPGNPAAAIVDRWPDLNLLQRENSIMALFASGTAAAQDHLIAVLAGDFDDSETARFRSASRVQPRPATSQMRSRSASGSRCGTTALR